MPHKRRRISRPRKIKTFEEVSTLTDTEYHLTDEGVVFYLEDKAMDELVTMEELMHKFYKLNLTQNPLVFMLQEDRYQPIPEKVWTIMWRGSFHMIVEKHESITEGPHACKLWFRSFAPPKKAYWIASAQVMAFYFNEKEMREAIHNVVKNRELFMLPQNAKIGVPL